MKRRWWIVWSLALLFLLPSLASAQGAACTGWCYVIGGIPSCGFTALQEGGRCSIVYDFYGNPVACGLWACSGGSGWTPENQGNLEWLETLPEKEVVRAAELKVRVTVVEPRS